MLHDVGKALLATSLPELYGPVVAAAIETEGEVWVAEREILGATHAAVGANLLGMWGLPGPIIEAVAFHHNPQSHGGTSFGPVLAVHAANVFAHEAGAFAQPGRPPSIDTVCCGGALTEERVASWRGACAPIVGG
jgi:HD-like signal output (HDOD) protein